LGDQQLVRDGINTNPSSAAPSWGSGALRVAVGGGSASSISRGESAVSLSSGLAARLSGPIGPAATSPTWPSGAHFQETIPFECDLRLAASDGAAPPPSLFSDAFSILPRTTEGVPRYTSPSDDELSAAGPAGVSFQPQISLGATDPPSSGPTWTYESVSKARAKEEVWLHEALAQQSNLPPAPHNTPHKEPEQFKYIAGFQGLQPFRNATVGMLGTAESSGTRFERPSLGRTGFGWADHMEPPNVVESCGDVPLDSLGFTFPHRSGTSATGTPGSGGASGDELLDAALPGAGSAGPVHGWLAVQAGSDPRAQAKPPAGMYIPSATPGSSTWDDELLSPDKDGSGSCIMLSPSHCEVSYIMGHPVDEDTDRPIGDNVKESTETLPPRLLASSWTDSPPGFPRSAASSTRDSSVVQMLQGNSSRSQLPPPPATLPAVSLDDSLGSNSLAGVLADGALEGRSDHVLYGGCGESAPLYTSVADSLTASLCALGDCSRLLDQEAAAANQSYSADFWSPSAHDSLSFPGSVSSLLSPHTLGPLAQSMGRQSEIGTSASRSKFLGGSMRSNISLGSATASDAAGRTSSRKRWRPASNSFGNSALATAEIHRNNGSVARRDAVCPPSAHNYEESQYFAVPPPRETFSVPSVPPPEVFSLPVTRAAVELQGSSLRSSTSPASPLRSWTLLAPFDSSAALDAPDIPTAPASPATVRLHVSASRASIATASIAPSPSVSRATTPTPTPTWTPRAVGRETPRPRVAEVGAEGPIRGSSRPPSPGLTGFSMQVPSASSSAVRLPSAPRVAEVFTSASAAANRLPNGLRASDLFSGSARVHRLPNAPQVVEVFRNAPRVPDVLISTTVERLPSAPLVTDISTSRLLSAPRVAEVWAGSSAAEKSRSIAWKGTEPLVADGPPRGRSQPAPSRSVASRRQDVGNGSAPGQTAPRTVPRRTSRLLSPTLDCMPLAPSTMARSLTPVRRSLAT